MSIAGAVSRRRAALDVVAQLIGQSVNVLLGAVVAVLLVRGLGDDRYGEWSSMLGIVGIVGYLGSLGLTQVTMRHAAAEPEREAEWFGALIGFRMLLLLPLTLPVVLGVEILNARGDEMLVAAVILTFLLPLGPPTALGSVYSLRVRNAVPVAVALVKSVLWTSAVALLFIGDRGLVAYAAALWVTTAATALLQVVLGLRLVRPAFAAGRKLWRPLLRVALPVAVGGMLILAYGRIDQIIVFNLAGADDAGHYAAAYRLLTASQFLPAAVLTTLFPLLSSELDRARLRRLVQLAVDHLAMVSLPLLAFAIVGSKPLLELLFGEAFEPSARALPPLMGAFVFICFGYLAGNLVLVLGLQQKFVWIAVAALVINVALNLVLVRSYGFVAAAWITLVTEAFVCSTSTWLCVRSLEMRLQFGRLSRVVAAAAAMAGVLALLSAAGSPLLVLVVASVVYVPFLVVVGALPLAELRALMSGGKLS
jgi:O-antigen/teichoic acid export membrane protein